MTGHCPHRDPPIGLGAFLTDKEMRALCNCQGGFDQPEGVQLRANDCPIHGEEDFEEDDDVPMNATPIKPIYEMPDHPHYGPVRRMWMMLEQMFADHGGVKVFEVAVLTFQQQRGLQPRPSWHEHLSNLIAGGISEPVASRIVMHQCLVAADLVL